MIATLIVRKPFTIPYAKEKAPEEVWDLLRGRVHGVLSATRRHQGISGGRRDTRRAGAAGDQARRLAAEQALPGD